MAINRGDAAYGRWVVENSDGTFSSGSSGDLWAWYRGKPSWDLSFLHTYTLTMFLGFLIAFLSVCYFWKRMKYSWEILQIMLIIIVPSSIVGARLWFLISEGGWSQWYLFSGLSIQGGVMGALVAVLPFLWSKRYAIDVRTVLGIAIPAVLIGQAIGRWGNFDNHEVYGKIIDGSSLNWLTFIKPRMLISDAQGAHYRIPLFFYESMINLAMYIILLWVIQRKNWFKPGVPAALYLIIYGITRIIMEPLRDPVDIMTWGSLHASSFIAGAWILAGFILFIWFQGLTRPFDKWALKIFPEKWLNKFQKEYKVITPIKPRRIFFFGELVETKGKYFWYFGEKVENRVKIWLPENNQKWSKREINSGNRQKNN